VILSSTNREGNSLGKKRKRNRGAGGLEILLQALNSITEGGFRQFLKTTFAIHGT